MKQKFISRETRSIPAIVFVLFMFITCSEPASSRVSFVLPLGYRGLFAIEKKSDAVVPKIVNGSAVFEIPSNGIFYTPSLTVFHEWHNTHARYVDGSILPTYPLEMKEGDDQKKIGLFSLSGSQDYIYFFVGTFKEYQDIRYKGREWESMLKKKE